MSSPLEPLRPHALVQTGTASMPSLARFHRRPDEPGWYVLTDPAGRSPVVAGADRTVDFGPAIQVLVFLVSIVGCGFLAARGETGIPVVLLYFLIGGCGGALVGGVLASLAAGLPHTWHRSVKDGPRLRVLPVDGQAWRLCETVAALAGTTSWTDRTVDPARRAPAVLWAAAQRSLEVERQYRDAERALDHDSLQDLGRETLARVEQERESLNAVEANLRTVLAAALDIDQQRARHALERRKWAEERELRSRMAGSIGPVLGPAESDRQADISAGLAAEAATVAELLAASDALLHDLD